MNEKEAVMFLCGVLIGLIIAAIAMEARWQKIGYVAAKEECEAKLPRDQRCVWKPEGDNK